MAVLESGRRLQGRPFRRMGFFKVSFMARSSIHAGPVWPSPPELRPNDCDHSLMVTSRATARRTAASQHEGAEPSTARQSLTTT